MENNLNTSVFQQARDLKTQSIEGLKQLCDGFANVRVTIDMYNQQQQERKSG